MGIQREITELRLLCQHFSVVDSAFDNMHRGNQVVWVEREIGVPKAFAHIVA